MELRTTTLSMPPLRPRRSNPKLPTGMVALLLVRVIYLHFRGLVGKDRLAKVERLIAEVAR